jgi:hypothetical protein
MISGRFECPSALQCTKVTTISHCADRLLSVYPFKDGGLLLSSKSENKKMMKNLDAIETL